MLLSVLLVFLVLGCVGVAAAVIILILVVIVLTFTVNAVYDVVSRVLNAVDSVLARVACTISSASWLHIDLSHCSG